MVWRAGLDAQCNYFNSTWLRFTGRSLEQEVGSGWTAGIHTDDMERRADTYLSHFERREPFELAYRLRRHDGAYRHILDRGTPFEDAIGKFAGFIGCCSDVQDRVSTEHAQARFLTMLTHELRTPLQLLTSQLDMLRRQSQRGVVPTLAVLSKLDARTERIAQLVTELSEAEQAVSGTRLELLLVTDDLCQLVRAAVAEAAEFGGRDRELCVVTELREARLRCDPARIRQLVRCLVDNAIKYSPAGGAIRIGIERRPGGYEVSVTDQGIGIPPEELPSLGRPYYRASNASPDRFAGIGLGLAMAQSIADAHAGRLWIESELGRGSIACFSVPEGLA